MNLSELINKHRHVWCFGCSFTKYDWQTWADLLEKKYTKVSNLGRAGAGNVYIFSEIMRQYLNGNISHNNLLMVCWTGHYRMDMKYKGKWLSPGNLLTQDTYPIEFVKKHCDPQYFLERDLYLAYTVNHIFKGRIINFSMGDIERVDQYNDIHTKHKQPDKIGKMLDEFYPSFYKVLWNNSFSTIKMRNDFHPTEAEHKRYLKQVFGLEV